MIVGWLEGSGIAGQRKAKERTSIAYLLNIADLALTLYALRIGLVEINPLMCLMMGIHPWTFVAVKIGAWPLFRWLGHHGSRWSRWAVVAALAITVAWNIANIVFWKIV